MNPLPQIKKLVKTKINKTLNAAIRAINMKLHHAPPNSKMFDDIFPKELEYASNPIATPATVRAMIDAETPENREIIIQNYLYNPNADAALLKELIPQPGGWHAWHYAYNNRYNPEFLDYLNAAGLTATFIESFLAKQIDINHFQLNKLLRYFGEDKVINNLAMSGKLEQFAYRYARDFYADVCLLEKIINYDCINLSRLLMSYKQGNPDPGFLDKLNKLAVFG